MDNPPKPSEIISKPHSLITATEFIANADNNDYNQDNDDEDVIQQIPPHEDATRANAEKKSWCCLFE